MNWIAWTWAGTAILAFILSLKIVAPYGRHVHGKWGRSIGNRLGWIVMEIPALVALPIFYWMSGTSDVYHLFLLGLWLMHYIHRTLIFPNRIRTKNKRIPMAIVSMAMTFNLINAYFVSRVFTSELMANWYLIPIGTLVFFTGMIVNIRSDYYLIRLREKGSGQYFIPKGGLFRYVSCPNHLGEILEWLGYFLLTLHYGTGLFLLWTVANLVPRSISHHRWYREKFEDYPPGRKAIFPFVL